MNWYERFAHKRRNFGIENLMGYVSFSMLILFFAEYILKMPVTQWFGLDMAMVMQGQVWRLITFVFMPQSSSLIWIIFSVYFYYMIGGMLENAWGKATFTLYYLLGMLGAIIAAVITGKGTSMYLNMSLFLATAILYPDLPFRIYFLVSVKAKYLGYVYMGLYALNLVLGLYDGIAYGRWADFAALIASLLILILFFGKDFIKNTKRKITNRRRRKQYERDLRGGNDR